MLKKLLVAACSLLALISSVAAEEVTVGGFAFAGDFKSAAGRFPLTYAVFEKLNRDKGQSHNLSREVIERMRQTTNASIQFNLGDKGVNLKDSDRALMSVLLLTGETVATENFGSYYKTFVNLRGDALIFDYKNQIVVRSYPLSVVLFDATPAMPTKEYLSAFVENLLKRTDGRGLISQYERRMQAANIDQKAAKTVQVRNIRIDAPALDAMPAPLKADITSAESIVADGFASIISAKLGISLLPRTVGHAVGNVMTMRLENGDDYKLKVGEGDYVFDIALKKFAKIKTAENNVATSFVYGAYVDLAFLEPSLGTSFLSTSIKNGETALVPTGQISNDDFPGYQDAYRGLFLKLTEVLAGGGDGKWIKTASSSSNIEDQISAARKILEECK
ncbi:hypothetical protein [Azoarcus sp. DN11]|uniref:hypothetical protein n=1 Tax=Azoarcus sp. DN11 TaxID=356837 RepID=UPI000EACAAC6|nr:hypothetical protein [Azoarcus sp. DN11]AYH46123.1 hypothetical protein CDA09_22555 [Azoarcus sp. DN11]